MSFNLDNLHSSLQPMPTCKSAMLALSGGMDSVVLLHGLGELSKQGRLDFDLRAMHVNHGLQQEADQWQQHCEVLCRQLAIPFLSERVELGSGDAAPLASLENAARLARYAAFAAQLQTGEALLLAHHRDDQMETLLLRLMRGSGSRGMGGMPRTRALGAGFLYRPLLDFDRSALQDYAQQQRLKWIDDKSNQDTRFDRNYCRHRLLPGIEERWPGYRDSWSKSAILAAEAEVLLQELAAIDLQTIATERDAAVNVTELQCLSAARQRNVLRHWLQRLGLPEFGWNQLQQLSNEVIAADPGGSASIGGEGFQLTRYKNYLYALQQIPAVDVSQQLDWNPVACAELELPANGSLLAKPVAGEGLRLATDFRLSIRYRSGGESCRLPGRPNKSVKKLLQENQVEPWYRDRLPLLYVGQELACIPGIGVCEAHAAQPGESGIVVDWSRPAIVLD